MSFRMGPLEIVIILVIVLLIFGVGKLPQVGEALGKGIRSFRKGQSGEDEEKKEETPKAEEKVAKEISAEKTEDTKEEKTEDTKEEKTEEITETNIF